MLLLFSKFSLIFHLKLSILRQARWSTFVENLQNLSNGCFCPSKRVSKSIPNICPLWKKFVAETTILLFQNFYEMLLFLPKTRCLASPLKFHLNVAETCLGYEKTSTETIASIFSTSNTFYNTSNNINNKNNTSKIFIFENFKKLLFLPAFLRPD